MNDDACVALYWIPLGAGNRVVQLSGRLYERIVALSRRRTPCELFHSTLVVTLPDGIWTIEQAPVTNTRGRSERGAVGEGPVGLRMLSRFRPFRYENRCWLDGHIPDLDMAVSGPVVVTRDIDAAKRVVDLVPDAPTYVWGRDQIRAGEMWNSNSLVAWVLTRSDLDTEELSPPQGGRAPGWGAGVVEARRVLRRPGE